MTRYVKVTDRSVAVPDDLYNTAQSVKQRGGRCWLVTNGIGDWHGEGPEPPQPKTAHTCTNCGGGTFVGLQVVSGGPYDVVPLSGNGESAVYEGGKWYKVRSRAYPCPICRVGERAQPERIAL